MASSLLGPHILEWTISKDFVTCLSSSLPNFVVYFFPSVHASQINVEVGREKLPRFMPLTMLWSAYTLLKFKCLSRWCQNFSRLPSARKCMEFATSALHTFVKVICTNSLHIKFFQSRHYSHLPQCLRLREIAPSTKSKSDT
jgi:hypothetical protein